MGDGGCWIGWVRGECILARLMVWLGWDWDWDWKKTGYGFVGR